MIELHSDFGLDPEIAKALAAMGAKLNPPLVEQSRALFANVQDKRLPAGGSRFDNLSYGPDARQTLDVCTPGITGAPIVVFVPGGGFVSCDKGLYRHIPAFFARQGFVAAAIDYRLAPQHQWPAGGADVAAALDWLTAHGEQFSADTSRLFVVAQSAGACHAATMLFHPVARPGCAAAIRAAVLMSGFYEMVPGSPLGVATQYFSEDTTLYADRSSTNHVATNRTPVMLTFSQYDPDFFIGATATMASALARRDGPSPPLIWLKSHNHLSPVLGLGGKTDQLGPAIVAALRRYA